MITALIGLVISLTILYIVYLLITWIFGFIAIVPDVFVKITYIIFVVIAFVIVLNFLVTLLGGTGWNGFNLR